MLVHNPATGQSLLVFDAAQAADWYWADDEGHLFGSRRGGFVADPEKDEAYLAWGQRGGRATRWPLDEDGQQTDAALAVVLAPYGIHYPPPEPLDAAKSAAAAAVQAARDALYRTVVPDAATQAEYDRKAALIRDGVPATGPVRDQIAAEASARICTVNELIALIQRRVEAYSVGILALGNITRIATGAIKAAPHTAGVAAALDSALDAMDDLRARLEAV